MAEPRVQDALGGRLTRASADEIRRLVLDESRRANVGHIGSSLCVADILAVLYGAVLRAEHPSAPIEIGL